MHSSLARTARRRRRAALSCYECHRRKVKCDRKDPCTRCVISKVPCTYDSSRPVDGSGLKSSPASVEYEVSSSNLSVSHEEYQPSKIVLPSCPESRDLLPKEKNVPSPRRIIVSGASSSELCTQEPQKNQEPNGHVQDINRNDLDRMSHFDGTSIAQPPVAQAVLNKNRVFGQSHWMSVASEFQFLTRSLIIPSSRVSEDTELNSTRKDASALLQKCKILARELKQDRPGRNCDTFTHTHIQQLPRDVADQAINIYLSYFESAFRVLHIPTLKHEYERYWTEVSNQCQPTRLKIQLCLTLGSSLLEDCNNIDVKNVAKATISAAQCWLSAPFEKNRLSINGLQVQCLPLLAREVFSIGGDLVWISSGTLVYSAIQMGLNRDPEHFPNLSDLQVQIRRRLWATIIELSLQASLDAGTFPLIRLEDFDTVAPANINDEDLDNTDTLSEKPDSVATDTSLQRVLLNSFPSRLQILRCMNGPKPEMSHESAILIATQLKTICQTLQSVIPMNRMHRFKRNMADFFLRRFILSLHHPFANQARKNPQYHYSRKVCLDAAMAMLSPPRDENFYRLVLIGGGMFKIRQRHLSLALGSELMSDIHDNGSLHTAYREMLLQALKQARGDAIARTGFGDTSARSNLLLSMIITWAELGNTDGDSELKMVQSAKTALEQTFSILKSLIETSTHSANEGTVLDLSTDLLPKFDVDIDEFLQLENWNSDIAMENWSVLLC